MKTELLPCPICRRVPHDANSDRYVFCGCSATPIIVGKTDEHAHQLWNAWVEGYNNGEKKQVEEQESCENCKFRRDDICKRNPPIQIFDGKQVAEEPPRAKWLNSILSSKAGIDVYSYDWCGEWKEKERK